MHFMMTLYSIMVICGITCLPVVLYGLPVVDESNQAFYYENYDFIYESDDNETLTTGGQEESTEVTDPQGYADGNETLTTGGQEESTEVTDPQGYADGNETLTTGGQEESTEVTDPQGYADGNETLTTGGQEESTEVTDPQGYADGNETLTTGGQEESTEVTDPQGYTDLNETGNCNIYINKCSGDEEPLPDVLDIGPPPYTDYAPDLCEDAKIDTITRTKSGNTYVFKGDFYWQVHPDGIYERYPRKISDDWDGLEGNLDASATWSNGRTFFFKDRRYWRFTDKKMDRWYPKLISTGFEGIPDNLDAALFWGASGDTYFFKGDKYWHYDMSAEPPTSGGYPKETSAWGDVLEDGVHAAFQWENKLTYLFKDDQYYRYNAIYNAIETDPPYPRSTAVEWFGCRSIDINSTETN